MLPQCDIVILNLPLTEKTKNLANAKFFSRMKKGAILVCTARGGLVNSQDLLSAIENGQLAGAGLDVLDHEPIQRDHIMVTAPEKIRKKIVFTPHIAGVSSAAFVRTYEVITDNIRRI